jgi:hypothetical protein
MSASSRLDDDHTPRTTLVKPGHPRDDAPAAPRERGLLRYSAGQRAPVCFYTSYRVCLAAAGTPSYAPPPPQPGGAPSAPPSVARRCGATQLNLPFSISHLFIFLPALVWPGYSTD